MHYRIFCVDKDEDVEERERIRWVLEGKQHFSRGGGAVIFLISNS